MAVVQGLHVRQFWLIVVPEQRTFLPAAFRSLLNNCIGVVVFLQIIFFLGRANVVDVVD